MKNNIQILEFTKIKKAKSEDNFRVLLIKDIDQNLNLEYHLWEKQMPYLWADLLDNEKKQTNPKLYSGHVSTFKGLRILILGNQTEQKAFDAQKWKLDKTQNITYPQAEKMREESEGYQTLEIDILSHLNMSHTPIIKQTTQIRFRYYHGVNGFSWGDWLSIKRIDNDYE